MTLGNSHRDARLPEVSVIVPVRNGGSDLEACLGALLASEGVDFECIVVDDASEDDSAALAERHGCQVIRLASQSGPAHARNRGALAARGSLLFFTDADCCVNPDTLRRAVETLRDPSLSAVIGSYDDAPASPTFIAQYKNLFHHWVHQTSREQASTFWTGCGAVRRKVFLEAGGFHEGYRKPSIEDIELGFRLRASGHAIRLDKRMQVKHLKRWRLLGLLRTDLRLRGVPWIALMLRDRHAPRDLNLSAASKFATVCALLFVVTLVALLATGRAEATLPALAAFAGAIASAALVDPTRRAAGWRSAVAVALVAGVPLALGIVLADPRAALPFLPWAGMIGAHFGFYRLLTSLRGLVFACATPPMQLAFLLVCAASVPLGVLEHVRTARRARQVLADGSDRDVGQPQGRDVAQDVAEGASVREMRA